MVSLSYLYFILGTSPYPVGGGVIPPTRMQIKEKTADKIINNLLDLLEEKDRKIDSLNAVISDLADESLSKSVVICKLLEGKEVNDG